MKIILSRKPNGKLGLMRIISEHKEPKIIHPILTFTKKFGLDELIKLIKELKTEDGEKINGITVMRKNVKKKTYKI